MEWKPRTPVHMVSPCRTSSRPKACCLRRRRPGGLGTSSDAGAPEDGSIAADCARLKLAPEGSLAIDRVTRTSVVTMPRLATEAELIHSYLSRRECGSGLTRIWTSVAFTLLPIDRSSPGRRKSSGSWCTTKRVLLCSMPRIRLHNRASPGPPPSATKPPNNVLALFPWSYLRALRLRLTCCG